MAQRRLQIAPRFRPDRVQRSPGLLQSLLLVLHDRQAKAAHARRVRERLGVSLARLQQSVPFALLRRRRPLRSRQLLARKSLARLMGFGWRPAGVEFQTGEHAALLRGLLLRRRRRGLPLRLLAARLGLARRVDLAAHAKLLGDPPPCRKLLGVVERRFLRSVAAKPRRQRFHRRLIGAPALEFLSRGIELRPVAVPRHRDIGQMPIHRPRRHDKAAVDRCALGFVDRRGVAVIDRRVIRRRDRHHALRAVPALAVELRNDPPVLDARHGAQHAVLHAKVAIVFKKHDAVARRE